ncbi:MAG: biotin carboxylase, partial [Eudoraea sp.]
MSAKKTTPAKKVTTTPAKKVITTAQLNGVPDIRRFFYKNEIPLYFISATNFNMLGADEWIKGFKFICH